MNKRALIVDDSGFMRKQIREKLSVFGYSVIGEADNGKDAVTLFNQLKPDLITMDVAMRGMDGLTAAREILKSDSSACIVMLTILGDYEFRRLAQLVGIENFVLKSDLSQLDVTLIKIENKHSGQRTI